MSATGDQRDDGGPADLMGRLRASIEEARAHRPAVARQDQGADDGERYCHRMGEVCRRLCPDCGGYAPVPAVLAREQLREEMAEKLRALVGDTMLPWERTAFRHKETWRARADALLDGPLAAVLAQAQRAEALAAELGATADRHQHAAPGSYDAGMRRGYSVAAEEIRASLRPGGAG